MNSRLEFFYRVIVVSVLILQAAWVFIPWDFAYDQSSKDALYWIGYGAHISPATIGNISIIFMVFYKKYKDRPDWIELWINVCNCFLLPYSHDAKGNYKFALAVARDALAIVNEPIPLPAKEHHILSLLNQACEFESSPMDAGRKRRKRKTPKQKTPKQKTPKQKTPKHRKKRKSYKRR